MKGVLTMDAQNQQFGEIKISEDVVATIAAEAAGSVEGVHALAPTLGSNIKEFIGLKNGAKGVSVTIGDDQQVTIVLNITLSYGYKIQETALQVQNAVMVAVNEMTGMGIEKVNVNVINVDIPKPAAEAEE